MFRTSMSRMGREKKRRRSEEEIERDNHRRQNRLGSQTRNNHVRMAQRRRLQPRNIRILSRFSSETTQSLSA